MDSQTGHVIYILDEVLQVRSSEYIIRNMETCVDTSVTPRLFHLLVEFCKQKKEPLKFSKIANILDFEDSAGLDDARIQKQIHRLNSEILKAYGKEAAGKKNPIRSRHKIGYYLDWPCRVWADKASGATKAAIDKEIKENALEQIPTRELYDGIRELLRKIPETFDHLPDKDKDRPELNYSPEDVDIKIPGDTFDEKLLHDKVHHYVVSYYYIVERCLEDMIAENAINENDLRKKIRYMYETYTQSSFDDPDASKSWTYEQLVNWLAHVNQSSSEVCDVVISYFVESCEVFGNETTG